MYLGCIRGQGSARRLRSIAFVKRILRQLTFVLILLLPLKADSPPENGRPITLQQAVEQGIVQSPTLKQSAENIMIARGQFEQTNSQKNLQFLFQDGTQALSKQNRLTTRQDPVSSQLSLTFQALLTTFGRVENEIAASYLQIDVATEQLEVDRQDLVLTIETNYFKQLQAEATQDAANQNLALTRQSLQDTKDMFVQGLAAKYDIVQAELQVVQAEQTLAQSSTDIGNTRVALKTSMYDLDPIPLTLAPPAPATVADGLTVEELVLLGYEHRPEIVVLERNILVADKLLEAAHNESKPIVTAQAGYFDTLGSILPTDTFGINFTVSWAIGDGGFREGKVKQAEAQVRALDDQLDQLRATVAQDVTQAWLNFQQEEFNLRTAIKQVESSTVYYDMARERFLNGLSTQLEVQTALQALINARLQVVVSTYNREISFSKLERTLGMTFPERHLVLPKGAPDDGN